ncbi:hypothetical protein B296_00002372 [Ensete ventricosum]|uniref:Helicase C-terminal domain-containing protein n=1 Tax=Ensete ventricosum TaxID=4639 RepID=A0A427B3D1_ENSVE|nr:hypothetical protein B296_00002372 [Ensete ventricosum]
MDSSVCIWAWLGWLLVRISKVPLMWLLVHRNEQQFKRCIDLVLDSPLEDKTLILFNLTFFPFQPMEIYVDDEAKLTLHGLVQHYIKLTELEKNRKLNDLLDALDFNQVVIFVKSVNRAAELNNCGNLVLLCSCRLTRYKNFKEGLKRILVATDLVGRGIDIERVNIVVNYDMPDSADTYLHRVNSLVQERFEVDIKELPEQIDTSTYKTEVKQPKHNRRTAPPHQLTIDQMRGSSFTPTSSIPDSTKTYAAVAPGSEYDFQLLII